MQGKVLSEPNATPAVYAGIDVCKEWLDVHVHPAGQSFRVANDGGGLRRLKRQLGGLAVTRVVMEATSKYHRGAQRSLHEAGLHVAVVNPLRARLFAEACGQLAKTDRIDARLLALMGAALDPAETTPGDCQEFCARGHDDGKERIITWLSRKNSWTSSLLAAIPMRCLPEMGCSTI
jgi:hypothetical protein